MRLAYSGVLGVLSSPWPKNVALVVASGRSSLGKRFLVIPHAVGVQEFLIDEIFRDHDVGEPFDQGCVGARTNRHPFVLLAQTGVRIDGINHDHAGALLTASGAVELPGLSAARLTRHHRVVAEGNVEFCVAHFGHLRTARAQAVGVGEGAVDLGRRIGAVATKRAAEHVEQAVGRAARGDELIRARTVLQINGFVAVFFDGVFELLGNDVKRLVPADAFELVFTSLAHALHRVFDALGRVQALAHRAAAQTGANVRNGKGHFGGVRAGVFGLDSNHLTVFDDGLQRAAAAAVDDARGPANRFHVVHGRRDGFAYGGEAGMDQYACRNRGLQKSPASEALIAVGHVLLSWV